MESPSDDPLNRDLDAFFANPQIREALSTLGIFAIDYSDGRAFASSVWRACGYVDREMDDHLFLERIHPDDRDSVQVRVNALLEGRQDVNRGTFRLRRKDGSWLWVAATYAVLGRNAQGAPRYYLGHDQDISDIKDREEELRQRLAEIETLGRVVVDVNASLDLNETVSRILEHTRRVLPYDRASVQLLVPGQLKVIGCTGFEDRDAILALRFPYPDPGNPACRALQSRKPLICNNLAREFPQFGTQNGEQPTLSWLGIPLLANNEVLGLMTLDSDTPGFYGPRHLDLAVILAGHVSLAIEKARVFDQVRTLALTDQLTGAGNRHSLQLQGPFFFEKARRDRTLLFALMVDLDYLKASNDEFGHDVGDQLLVETARRIRGCLRSYDLFYRYGGDEFLVILPDSDATMALEIAQRIQAAFPGAPTVSLGLGALVPNENATLSDLIKEADLALYEAKESGRNRLVVRPAPVTTPA